MEPEGTINSGDELTIGSISILVVLPAELDHDLSQEELTHLINLIKEQFELGIERKNFASFICVGDISSEYSCLIITIPLTIKISAIALGGFAGLKGAEVLKNFIIEYPQIKQGLNEIAKDIKRVSFRLRGKQYDQGTCIRKSELISKDEAEKLLREKLSQIEENEDKDT